MAILKNIQCSIHTDAKRLDEYEDEEVAAAGVHTPDSITRYIDIDGTEGHNFFIRMELQPSFSYDPKFPYVLGSCKVDNIEVRGGSLVCSASHPTHNSYGPRSVKYVDGKEVTFRKEMFFSRLNFVEENNGHSGAIHDPTDPRLQSLGRIEIRVMQGAVLVSGVGGPSVDRQATSSITAIHQKAVKGKATSHGVQIGAAKEVGPSNWSTFNYLESPTRPFATFIFLYRPRSFLENMGIIPINNQALDLPHVVKPDDANKSPQELLEEVQSLRAKLKSERATQVKRERTQQGMIKDERRKKMKTWADLTGEEGTVDTIDLTGEAD